MALTKSLTSTLANGRYLVKEKLGEGGMGSVYRAEDRNLSKDVVIKSLRGDLLRSPGVVQQFFQEIRSTINLAHPHIVPVIDVGENDGVPYAVMQYLAGGSLDDHIRDPDSGRIQPQRPESLLKWLADLAAAIDFIHDQQFIHRDVKPSNILFDQHGNVFLSDFGIGEALASSDDNDAGHQTAKTIGTPSYMAPELLMERPHNQNVDQYALAVSVYQILTGRLPYEGSTHVAVLVQHAEVERIPPIHEFRRSVSKNLSKVIAKGMNPDPEQRYPTCTLFAAAVIAAVGKSPKPPANGYTRHRHLTHTFYANTTTDKLESRLAKNVGQLGGTAVHTSPTGQTIRFDLLSLWKSMFSAPRGILADFNWRSSDHVSFLDISRTWCSEEISSDDADEEWKAILEYLVSQCKLHECVPKSTGATVDQTRKLADNDRTESPVDAFVETTDNTLGSIEDEVLSVDVTADKCENTLTCSIKNLTKIAASIVSPDRLATGDVRLEFSDDDHTVLQGRVIHCLHRDDDQYQAALLFNRDQSVPGDLISKVKKQVDDSSESLPTSG